jgi:hypothetical protein
MAMFGDLLVKLDPWQVDYGAELPFEDVAEGADDAIAALDPEHALDAWRPIRPDQTSMLSQLVFVDGVRRVEARLIIRRQDRLCHGAFGSHAVGSVRSADAMAFFAENRVTHLVVVGAGESIDAAVPVKPGLVYQPLSTADTHPDAPLRALQEDMRIGEERLGRDLANTGDALVITDGPLTFEDTSRAPVLGYIKRIFKLYLPRERLGLLAALRAGERTPLFALRSSQRFSRFSWFMRLADPFPGAADLAGIARLEVSEVVGAEAARRLANASTAILSRFVPGRWRDPRSPQNLLPIGALEADLRRQMGDGRLVRRHIETLIATEARGARRGY